MKISFEKLVDDHGRQVLNTATRILADSQKAQDVHQQVFLEIWRRWHKFDGRTNWAAYLYRTTVRKAIALAREARTEPLVQQNAEHVAAMHDPDEQLRAAELQQKLTDCLTRLPKRQAEVFALARIEGLKPEKIAEILGCSHQTVRVHLHRAMKRLADELSDYLNQ